MDTNIITALFDKIVHTPAAMLLILVISILAYGLEIWDRFNSRFIPLVCIGAGPVLAWLFMSPGQVDPSYPHPQAVIAAFGIVLGFIASIAHKFVIAKLVAKFAPPDPPSVTPNTITQSEPPKV